MARFRLYFNYDCAYMYDIVREPINVPKLRFVYTYICVRPTSTRRIGNDYRYSKGGGPLPAQLSLWLAATATAQKNIWKTAVNQPGQRSRHPPPAWHLSPVRASARRCAHGSVFPAPWVVLRYVGSTLVLSCRDEGNLFIKCSNNRPRKKLSDYEKFMTRNHSNHKFPICVTKALVFRKYKIDSQGWLLGLPPVARSAGFKA